MKEAKQIVAGYLWQGKWTGPGFPIYPEYWSEKPSEDRPYHTQADFDRYQKEMAESPADEVLDIEPGFYRLNVNYPVSEDFGINVEIGAKGITRQALMDAAADAYHQVYKYVNEGIYAKDLDDVEKESNKYGIWGHSMGDLTIHTFYVDEEKNVITLGVDS